MRSRHITGLSRKISGPLLYCALMSGCASAPPTHEATETAFTAGHTALPTPIAESSTASDLETLDTMVVAPLTPEQALEERNMGQRIRWDGAVQRIAATGQGVCLTIVHAPSSETGEPRRTSSSTYRSFEACTAGAYDPDLVREFTTVTIVGRITGRAEVGSGGGGRDGPVVQIEKLFRWSDCLQGDDSPGCRYGFLSPQGGKSR